MSEGARVLVAYATAHGSTKGVAERIATRLAEAGAQVDAGLSIVVLHLLKYPRSSIVVAH